MTKDNQPSSKDDPQGHMPQRPNPQRPNPQRPNPQRPNPQRPNPRRLPGTLLLIAGLAIYVFIAAAIGELLIDLPLAIEMIYYAVAGIIWIFPAYRLLVWSAGPRQMSAENQSHHHSQSGKE